MLSYSDKIKSHSQLPVCMITTYVGEDGEKSSSVAFTPTVSKVIMSTIQL